jgi:hypothetical protein
MPKLLLADLLTEAGINDLAEGAEVLLASDDAQARSAMVGLMSIGDLEGSRHPSLPHLQAACLARLLQVHGPSLHSAVLLMQ